MRFIHDERTPSRRGEGQGAAARDPREYRVGELAAELGVKPKTVRYYGEIGLLPAPRRSSAGYRLYGARDRESLRFILKAKAVGLSLSEIREIVDLKNRGVRPCAHVATLIDAKLDDVRQQMDALEAYRMELHEMRQRAAGPVSDGDSVCGIIERQQISRPGEVALAAAAVSRVRFKSR